MIALNLNKNHFYEISDAITAHLDSYLETGDPEQHETKYGTLTLLNEAQAELYEKFQSAKIEECLWYPDRLKKIQAIRRKQKLPIEPTANERSRWAMGT